MTKFDLINKANEREFYILVGDRKLKAKIAGNKLEYPKAYSIDNSIDVEISWGLVERIANGITQTII